MKRVLVCVVCVFCVCFLLLPCYAAAGPLLPEGGFEGSPVLEIPIPDGGGVSGNDYEGPSKLVPDGFGTDFNYDWSQQDGYLVLPGAFLTYDELLSLIPSEPEPEGYLSYDDFISYNGDDYSVSVVAVQTAPNSPVTPDGNGLKSILLTLFGDYSPVITQLRYQANNNSTYTYVNDIQFDVPWIASAVIFTVVLYCVFKLGGTLFCKA